MIPNPSPFGRDYYGAPHNPLGLAASAAARAARKGFSPLVGKTIEQELIFMSHQNWTGDQGTLRALIDEVYFDIARLTEPTEEAA